MEMKEHCPNAFNDYCSVFQCTVQPATSNGVHCSEDVSMERADMNSVLIHIIFSLS